MGGAYSTYIWREEVCTGFWWGNVREIDYLEDPGLDERIILRWIFKKWNGCGGTEWNELTSNRDRWRANVNVVMNLRVS